MRSSRLGVGHPGSASDIGTTRGRRAMIFCRSHEGWRDRGVDVLCVPCLIVRRGAGAPPTKGAT